MPASAPRIVPIHNKGTNALGNPIRVRLASGEPAEDLRILPGYTTVAAKVATNKLRHADTAAHGIARQIPYDIAVTIDWMIQDRALLLLTGNCTIAMTGGLPWQRLTLTIGHGSGAYQVEFGEEVLFGSDVKSTMTQSTAANAYDELTFLYDPDRQKYLVSAFTRGY